MKRKTSTDISDSIKSVSRKCKDECVNDVAASSIVYKKSSRFQMKISEVNSLTFIDNGNINKSDVCDDLIHLKYSGTCKLANNFINFINKVLGTTQIFDKVLQVAQKMDLNLRLQILGQYNNFPITMTTYYQNLGVTLKINRLLPI